MAAVEALWCLTGSESLKEGGWMGVVGEKEKEVLEKIEEETTKRILKSQT